jgi:hypothetical protein
MVGHSRGKCVACQWRVHRFGIAQAMRSPEARFLPEAWPAAPSAVPRRMAHVPGCRNPRCAIGVLIGLIPCQFLGRDARCADPVPAHPQAEPSAPAHPYLPRGRAVLFGKAAQRRLGRIVGRIVGSIVGSIVGHSLIDPTGMPEENGRAFLRPKRG